MPKLDRNSRISVDDWTDLQASEQTAYIKDYLETGSYFGHFSEPGLRATARISSLLRRDGGRILDVGCGILNRPDYLAGVHNVTGIDPYRGDTRNFPFCQAVGERLPFASESFDTVLFMSILDHALDPFGMIAEARRVLVKGGRLFVWYISRDRPDRHHLWYFNTKDLMAALAGFEVSEFLPLEGQGRFPRTHLLIVRKATL